MSDFELDFCAIRLISGAALADREEIVDAIQYLETKIIGTGYYEGQGDELLQQIVSYLKEKIKLGKS